MKKKLVISILALFTITCVFSIPPVDDGKLIFHEPVCQLS